MKIGVMLRQSAISAEVVVETAVRAERLGIDGVFLRDHLFFVPDAQDVPPVSRWLHSCIPMLSAIAAKTSRIHVGSLVIRNGLLSHERLLSSLETLKELAGQRLIVGLGVGDALSAPENDVMNYSPLPFDERIDDLDETLDHVTSRGVETWVGGRSAAMRQLATEHNVVLNQWEAPADLLKPGDTWGGQLDDPVQVDVLAKAGASWAVFVSKGLSVDPKSFVDDVALLLRR